MIRPTQALARFLRVLCLAFLAFVGLARLAPSARAAPAEKGEKIVIGPRAPWVDVAPDQSPGGGAPPATALGDVFDEISDEQIHVRAVAERGLGAHLFTTAHYTRTRRHIVTSSGVERASELRFQLDPAYERLVIHSIRVIRDGVARDVLDLDSIRVFAAESGADERIYDGSMIALAVVPDVRPGDVIDSEVTTEGENPVFDGHFADALSVGNGVWTRWLRVRVVVPASRAVTAKVLDGDLRVRERDLGAEREYAIEREGVPATKDEHDTPPWFLHAPQLRVSDYRSWAEVAEWAAPLYERADRDAAIEKKAAELREVSPTPEARALAAIRFVQDDVRYLGIEIGEFSHRPHTSGSVLRQRFGDCKDKSLLLVSLLRALDLDASVALVNTRLGARIADQPPSHFAFNHAVVQLRAGGRVLWIDATGSLEGGGLDRYTTMPYGRALVVAKETRDLTTLPEPQLAGPTTVTRETYRTSAGGNAEGATLDVETTFLGDDADATRARLARSSREDIAARYLNYYASFEPKIRPRSELVIADDRARNVVVVKESYQIPDLLREGEVRLHATSLGAPLETPKTLLRTTPLAVPHPYWARHEIEVHLASPPEAAPKAISRTTDAFTFERKVHTEGNIVTTELELRTRVDAVRVADLEVHLRVIDQLRDLLHPVVRIEGPLSINWTAAGWCGGGLLGFVALVFGYAYAPRWWRRRSWRREQSFGRGDTAKTARPMKSLADAERDLLGRKCACGAKLTGPIPDSAWSTIALGDTSITVGRADCACGAATRRYYVGDGLQRSQV